MGCKKLLGRLVCSAAIGASVMAPLTARAQDATTGGGTDATTGGTMGGTTGGTMDATMGAGGMTSTQPVAVSGTVVRYYTDRSGYVTAADIQTANGIQMVHFSPGMGQRLYTTSPTGGQINVWVTPSAMGAGHWDVVGVGANMPAAGFMNAYTTTAVDLLDAEPYIMAGAQLMTVRGRLNGLVTANNGEVLALVLDNADIGSAAMGARGMNNAGTGGGTGGGTDMGAGGTMGGGTDMGAGGGTMGTGTGGTMSHGMWMSPMTGRVLVRVPRELRHISPGALGTGRVTPLFRGAEVTAKGYLEAPRYGAISTFSDRLVANAIVVDGRSVGALGVPMMRRTSNTALFGGLDIPLPGGAASPEEIRAMQMGYTTYTTDGTMGGSGTASGSTGGATGTGTAGAGGIANQ